MRTFLCAVIALFATVLPAFAVDEAELKRQELAVQRANVDTELARLQTQFVELRVQKATLEERAKHNAQIAKDLERDQQHFELQRELYVAINAAHGSDCTQVQILKSQPVLYDFCIKLNVPLKQWEMSLRNWLSEKNAAKANSEATAQATQAALAQIEKSMADNLAAQSVLREELAVIAKEART